MGVANQATTNQMKTHLKKNHRKTLRLAARKAFSLVELLVVIAVIGIIAAIAIPNIANITGSASAAKNMRNAQSIASMFASAKATGWDPANTNPAVAGNTAVTSVDTAIDAFVAGVTSPSGATFKVPMSTEEVTSLKAGVADAGLTWSATDGLVYAKPAAAAN